jgi:hypothetical protein
MKKWMLLLPVIAGILFSFVPMAQMPGTFYVASKSGLSIREKPDAKATVLGKIPYGTKITISYPENESKINTEGIDGVWAKTTFGGKTGYIVNSYLFSSPPPKPTIKTMKEYLAQLSTPFGAKLVVKNGTMNNVEEGGSQLQKQLYKNGAEWHEFGGYEYSSNTYFLPDFTLQQGFLLLRMIPEFKVVWTDKDEFPTADKKLTKGDIEYEIKVEKEMLGDTPWIKRISIGFADGGVYTFEMYQLDNQLVIFYGSGI